MGEIVPAKIRLERRVLLVGQAPGADGDVRPLTGTMGERLALLAGVDGVPPCGFEQTPPDERIGLWFARANVLDFYPGRKGKGHAFPPGLAAAAAEAMIEATREYDRVLFCGKAVSDAFRRAARNRPEQNRMWREWAAFHWTVGLTLANPYSVSQPIAWMPHTSMIVPWWNDQSNVDRASGFLRDLVAWTRGRPMRAVA